MCVCVCMCHKWQDNDFPQIWNWCRSLCRLPHERKGTQECWRADVTLTLKYLAKTHTHARTYTFSHAFVFNTIYVAGKGTSWWNPLNTLFTEDMWRWREGEEKERGSGKRGRSKKEAQVETLIFRDVWLRLKYKQKSRKVFTHRHI